MRPLLSCLLWALIVAAASGAKGPVRVFILAGQSNMEGHGAIHALDKDGSERPGTLAWMMANPAKAKLVHSWRDDGPNRPAETIQIEASNANFGDPAPGVSKHLRIDYSIDGKSQSRTVSEGETITLPSKQSTVQIQQALYGDLPSGAKVNVTQAVQKMIEAERKRPRWKARPDVWVAFNGRTGHLAPGFGAGPDLFGPELGFGQVMGDALDEPVLIIKTAWGGKSLFEDFRPPSSGGKVGPFYRQLLSSVKDGIASIAKDFPELAGRPVVLSGLVWWQGWNDAYPKGAVPEYENNLVNLIGDLRHDLQAPELPIVVAELTGPWIQADHPWAEIRTAQEAATNLRKHPQIKGNVVFVPTRQFVRAESDSPGGWPAHEFDNAETYYRVGQASAEAMKGLLTKRVTTTKPRNSIKDYGLKSYVRVSKDLPHVEDKPWKLVCEMPYNCHFQPWLMAEGPVGQEIKFNSSNPLVLYLTPTESCTTKSGPSAYEAKNWISGEGAIYTIPAGVKVNSVQYRETGYDTAFTGSFECNDEDLNTLWRGAARTAYLCMRDHFYDCPDRERVGFWGDGTPELDQCFYLFDKRSHDLCQDLVLRKLEPKFYPGQHLEFLGEYGLWYYYLQTGDLDSINAVYEQTKTFLLQTYQTGNPKTWFDWGNDSKDTSVIETCFLYTDLGTLRKMAVATGHEADLALIDARREKIKSSFDARFWKGSYYQSGDVAAPDDRANAMAVNAGLADRSKWEAIYTNVIAKTTNSSCFFDRWVFEALCQMGKEDKALLRMKTRYRTMIDSGFTSLWEHYDRWWASWLNAFDEASSLNHGWNPPVILLAQQIAGVQPIEPGWKTFEVLPKESSLTHIKLTVPSIKGLIVTEIEKTSKQYALSLTSPAETSAIVGIPKRSFSKLSSITVNGQVIWNGQFCGYIKGVAWVGDDGDYLKFKVAPGSWRFIGRGQLPVVSAKGPRTATVHEKPLDSRAWTATASVPDASFPFSGDKIPIDASAANAIDGDRWTGWRDMTQTQHPGQWIAVDMKVPTTFGKIVLENSWALYDSPNRYEVRVSNDGTTWSPLLATGRGRLGSTSITLPPQTARWIKITQTGSDPVYHWSIYEINIYNVQHH